MYDLKSEDPEEPGLPDQFHIYQPRLLEETFHPIGYPRDQIFMGTDLNVYYDPRHPQWYKRPDWFAVLGVSQLYEEQDLRLSYVLWQEGVDPFIVVELLSPGTEKEDLGQTLREVNQPPTKWEVYERILKIPYYVVFDRYTDNLRVFMLQGDRYAEQTLEASRFWIDSIELGLGLWQGIYQGIHRQWLRWFDRDGNWLPTLTEQKQQEQEKTERLAAKLRELGVNPDEI
jgi:Uma2 family endonuclease